MALVALDAPPPVRFDWDVVTEMPSTGRPGPVSDEHLIAQAAAGDPEQAMAALYDRYATRIFGLGLHQLGNPTLAEDLVQETFVRVWQAAPRFDPARASAATFIFTIARRHVVDMWRRRSARPTEADEDPDGSLPNDVEALLTRLAVREAMESLSPTHREVIEAAHARGLTQSEIAEELGIPLGTVKTRTYHALRALRTALEQRGIHG